MRASPAALAAADRPFPSPGNLPGASPARHSAIARGVLVFSEDDSAPVDPALAVAGLSLLERGLRTMARAGIRDLLIVLPRGAGSGVAVSGPPPGVRVEYARWGDADAAAAWPQDDFLLMRGDSVHHHSSLTALLASGLGSHDVVDYAGSGVYLCRGGVLRPQDLVAAHHDLDAFLAERLPGYACVRVRAPADRWCQVTDSASARRARDMLFGQVTKSTSGTVARLLNVRLSVPLSKLLVTTGISPDAVTLLLVLLPGLLSAYLVSTPAPHLRVAAAGVLWQLASVLDGCDGEIARVKLAETRFGAWLDTVTDNLSYLCGFFGLMVGVHRLQPGDPLPVAAGVSSLVALGAALVMLYIHAHRSGTGSLQHYLGDLTQRLPEEGGSWTLKLVARLGFVAKRDFLALALALALVVGQMAAAFWFLVALFHVILFGVAGSYALVSEGPERAPAPRQPAAAAPAATAAGRVEAA